MKITTEQAIQNLNNAITGVAQAAREVAQEAEYKKDKKNVYIVPTDVMGELLAALTVWDKASDAFLIAASKDESAVVMVRSEEEN